ncbi:MAG: peptidyl-alpha-hydroxyglycine alpha-amidating lyase family protein [Vicinamibacterales bacterium]
MPITRIALIVALIALAPGNLATGQTPASRYEVVENWATFPEGVTNWSAATGVDIDPRNGNIYVFHRNEAMPIMAFDKNGKFLRAWGQGMFKTTHFLRTDREWSVWVTDRGDHQVFKFSPEGKLLMTLGKKGVIGDNHSRDAFNGVADLVIAKNGDIFIADGESTNTRVVKYSKDGTFATWWGGLGKAPGEFDEPHSIAIDSDGRLYVGDRRNKRVQVFEQGGKFLKQWTNLGTPWGVFVKGDRLYVVDGTDANVLFIASTKDGKILDRIEGLHNATAVTVDANDAIYVGEVNGTNVRKFVRKR